jgi:SLT domain-containing protein
VVHRASPAIPQQPIIGDPQDVPAWIHEGMSAAHVSGWNWYSGLAIIAEGESSDNMVVEPGQPGYFCDSNCQAHTPSEGIVQTIRYTFDTYHAAGTSWSMLNPPADIAAAIRYIENRYGTISNVPGVLSVRAGGSYRGY